jgi:hypothetical protein
MEGVLYMVVHYHITVIVIQFALFCLATEVMFGQFCGHIH